MSRDPHEPRRDPYRVLSAAFAALLLGAAAVIVAALLAHQVLA